MVKFGITLRMALVFIICGGPLQALTGDLNCNGRVDLSDFFIFADNFGTQGEVGAECAALVGDFDCDRSVDLTDFFLFADNFGKEGVVEPECGTVAGETEEDDSIVGGTCRSSDFRGSSEGLFMHVANHAIDRDISEYRHATLIVDETHRDDDSPWKSRIDLTAKSLEVAFADERPLVGRTLSFNLIPDPDDGLNSNLTLIETSSFRFTSQGSLLSGNLIYQDGSTLEFIHEEALSDRTCNQVTAVITDQALRLVVNGVPQVIPIDTTTPLNPIRDSMMVGPYPGRVWDVRIYDRTLVDIEIAHLAENCGEETAASQRHEGNPNYLCGVYVCEYWPDGTNLSESNYQYYIKAQDEAYERFVFDAMMYPRENLCNYLKVDSGRTLMLSDGIRNTFVRPFSYENPLVVGNSEHWHHENFHSFQGRLSAQTGFGCSKFTLESTASWGSHHMRPGTMDDLLGYFTLHPHLPLWTTQSSPVDDYAGWEFKGGHQYGASVFWNYLTWFVLSPRLIGDVFNDPRCGQSPIGVVNDLLAEQGYDMKEVYADFASRLATWDMQYGELLRDSEAASLDRMRNAKPDAEVFDAKNTIAFGRDGTGDVWTAVPRDYKPGGWAYNSYRIHVTSATTLTADYRSLPVHGEVADFRARVVVHRGEARIYHVLRENQALDITAEAGDTVYLIVASTPNVFVDSGSNWRFYDYEFRFFSQGEPPVPTTELRVAAKIFLMAGQSNMVGHGNSNDLIHIDPRLLSPRSDVWARAIIEPNKALGPLAPGFGSGERSFGPELGFGHVVGDVLEEEVYLFKAARGGTSISDPTQWRPPSRGGNAGNLYYQMLEGLNGFLEEQFPEGDGYEIAGFVWFQGYNDALNTDTAQEYEVNLRALLADLRSAEYGLGIDDLPVVICQLNDIQGANGAIVSQAHATVADEDPQAAWILTGDQRPYYHYGAASYAVIGDRAGRAMISLLSRPVAHHDTFTLNRSSSIEVPSDEGVLANDLGDNLEVELIRAPEWGVFDLATDGGFSFEPPQDFVGPAYFSYRVLGAGKQGTVADATIWVRDLAAQGLFFEFEDVNGSGIGDSASGIPTYEIGDGVESRQHSDGSGSYGHFQGSGGIQYLWTYPAWEFLDLSTDRDFLVSMRIRPETSGETRILISNKYWFDRNGGWSVAITPDGGIRVHVGPVNNEGNIAALTFVAPAENDQTDSSLYDGNWHEVSVAFEFSQGKIIVMRDGAVLEERTVPDNVEGHLERFESVVGDGSEGGDGHSHGFKGDMDDVRLQVF